MKTTSIITTSLARAAMTLLMLITMAHGACGSTIWTLQAKLNANDEWTVIDSRNVSQNGSDALPGGRNTGKDYTVQHPGTYQYFHFEVLQTGGSYMCLPELALQCYNLEPINVENPMFTGVTINGATPTAVTSGDGAVSFMGSYSPVGLAANDRTNLYLGSGNRLYYPSTATTIGSFRANLLINNIRGDVNGDGATNVTDVTMMVDYILGITSNNFIFDNADVNRDGSINVTDVTTLVDIILGNYNNDFDVVTNLDDTPINYGGGGSGPARAKGQ